MRSKVAAALAVVLAAALARGQTGSVTKLPTGGASGTTKSGLEAALAEALKNNPDLRVAVGKLHAAEAEASRARLQVMQKVVVQYQAVEQARATAAQAEANLARLLTLHKSGAVPQAQVVSAQSELARAKMSLAAAQAELDYLRGKSPRPSATAQMYRYQTALASYYLAEALAARKDDADRKVLEAWLGVYRAHEPMKAPMADKLRKALDRPVTLKLENAPAREVVKLFQKDNPGIHLQLSGAPGAGGVTASLTDVPFAAALQVLEDSLPDYRIVVRDYGLLIAPKERVPAGAVALEDFWKSKASAGPAKAAEGTVAATLDNGKARVNVGREAGVRVGQRLEAYRLAPRATYLGQVEVEAVHDGSAIVRPVGRLGMPLQRGDRVSSGLGLTR